MNRLKGRVDKLSRRDNSPVIICLMEGELPNDEQRLKIARAAAAGVKPLIIQVVRASKCLKTE